MLSPLINSDIFTIIGYILGTLSGVLIGLSRILNYKLYREINEKIFKRNEFIDTKDYSISLFEKFPIEALCEGLVNEVKNDFSSIYCFGELYDNISTKVILIQNISEILCALSIYFYKARISPGLNIEEKDRTHKAIFSSNGSVFTRRNLTKLGGINNLENNPDLVLYEYKPRLFANLRERLFHSNTEIYE